MAKLKARMTTEIQFNSVACSAIFLLHDEQTAVCANMFVIVDIRQDDVLYNAYVSRVNLKMENK